MNIDHRRPLAAFICVTVLCALVMVQATLYVIRSPLGSGLTVARALVSTLGDSVAPSLLPDMVAGATLLERAEAPAGTTVETRVPMILALPEIAPALASLGAEGGATTSAGDARTDSAEQTSTRGRPQQERGSTGAGDQNGNSRGNGHGRPPAGGPGPGEEPGGKPAPGLAQLTRLIELAGQIDLEDLVQAAEQPELVELAQLIELRVEQEEPIGRQELVGMVALMEPVELAQLDDLAADVEEPDVEEPDVEEPDRRGARRRGAGRRGAGQGGAVEGRRAGRAGGADHQDRAAWVDAA